MVEISPSPAFSSATAGGGHILISPSPLLSCGPRRDVRPLLQALVPQQPVATVITQVAPQPQQRHLVERQGQQAATPGVLLLVQQQPKLEVIERAEECPAPLDLSCKGIVKKEEEAVGAKSVATPASSCHQPPLPTSLPVAPAPMASLNLSGINWVIQPHQQTVTVPPPPPPPPPQATATLLEQHLLPTEPFPIGRTSSCSSSTSTSSSASSIAAAAAAAAAMASSSGNAATSNEQERRLKRKEQNKAAAHNYRQRKKSFSDMIETEHEALVQRNLQLLARKSRLEEQIKRMRQLLNDSIREAKRAEEEERRKADELEKGYESDEPQLVIDDAQQTQQQLQQTTHQQAAGPQPPQSDPLSDQQLQLHQSREMQQLSHQPGPSSASSRNQNNIDSLDFAPRPRKNTWPMTLSSRDRKKQQNKLASRRFRQRRKMEQSNCEIEAMQLEADNRRLRERMEELESKIGLIKDLMHRKMPGVSAQQQPMQQPSEKNQ